MGGEGQVDGDPGDRPQRAPGGRGHRRDRADLAELIVQLGHDWPSHILVPAIHRNRAEIREIFLREMPGVGERPTSRGTLRWPHGNTCRANSFLHGLPSAAPTSVSQKPARLRWWNPRETGGCADPPEDLDHRDGHREAPPDFADLEVFMQLLPRSSTAERMNPYTRCGTECTSEDGPEDSSGVAGQRAKRGARRRGGTRRAALHPVQRVPQRVSGVRTHRRPRIRVGVSRSDRGNPEPAADRYSPT